MESTTLVLMGRTGNGKSSTGNSILGRDAFIARYSAKSVTNECKMEQSGWKDGRMINVVDTPGLFDTGASNEFIEKEIVKCINLAKDGIHGVLLVLSTKEFTEEETNVLDNLQMLFGPRIVNYMVVVFTGGDQLEKYGFTLEKFLDVCPHHIKELVRRCNSRTVLFDNKTTSEIEKEKQIKKLLEHVDSIIAENENQPYSNELFSKAKEIASQLFYVRDKENAYAEQVTQLQYQKKAYAEQVTQLQYQKNAYAEQVTQLQSQKKAYAEQVTQLQYQKNDYAEQVQRLQCQKNDYAEQVQRLQYQKNDYAEQVQRLNATMEQNRSASDQTISNLQQQLRQARNELASRPRLGGWYY